MPIIMQIKCRRCGALHNYDESMGIDCIALCMNCLCKPTETDTLRQQLEVAKAEVERLTDASKGTDAQVSDADWIGCDAPEPQSSALARLEYICQNYLRVGGGEMLMLCSTLRAELEQKRALCNDACEGREALRAELEQAKRDALHQQAIREGFGQANEELKAERDAALAQADALRAELEQLKADRAMRANTKLEQFRVELGEAREGAIKYMREADALRQRAAELREAAEAFAEYCYSQTPFSNRYENEQERIKLLKVLRHPNATLAQPAPAAPTP